MISNRDSYASLLCLKRGCAVEQRVPNSDSSGYSFFIGTRHQLLAFPVCHLETCVLQ